VASQDARDEKQAARLEIEIHPVALPVVVLAIDRLVIVRRWI